MVEVTNVPLDTVTLAVLTGKNVTSNEQALDSGRPEYRDLLPALINRRRADWLCHRPSCATKKTTACIGGFHGKHFVRHKPAWEPRTDGDWCLHRRWGQWTEELARGWHAQKRNTAENNEGRYQNRVNQPFGYLFCKRVVTSTGGCRGMIGVRVLVRLVLLCVVPWCIFFSRFFALLPRMLCMRRYGRCRGCCFISVLMEASKRQKTKTKCWHSSLVIRSPRVAVKK